MLLERNLNQKLLKNVLIEGLKKKLNVLGEVMLLILLTV
jgi:hypothetical protein